VASVGSFAISAKEVAHLMITKSAKFPVPTPPDYSACIAGLKAHPSAANPGLPTSFSGLKEVCSVQYKEQLAASLGRAIHNRWVLGQAAEMGVSVSASEVRREVEEGEKQLGSRAALTKYLKENGQTLPEVEFEAKLNLLTTKMLEAVAERKKVSAAPDAARFYAQNKRQFTTSEGRETHILRTATEASAKRAKQELAAGKSFASVVQRLSGIGQPLKAQNGTVKDLKPGIYQEPALDDAIFSAKPNRLYGPIKITAPHKTIAPEAGSGFFIFEVKRIVPARTTPFAKVKDSISRQLAKQRRLQVSRSFSKSFKHKWKARTDCHPGYVLVPLCRQFKLTKALEAAEDPYTV
jgi:hypothetical protein